MNTIIISYTSSVFTSAGWRSIDIVAEATKISPGMAQVLKVIGINGESPKKTQSRTGARRQQFSGTGIAVREMGARKRLSACKVIKLGEV